MLGYGDYIYRTICSFLGDMATLGDKVLTPSPAARRMAEGSKTNRALFDLVRDRMTKATGISYQQARMSPGGPGEGVTTSSGLPPWPKRARKMEGMRWTP